MGNVMEAMSETKALLDRFNEVSGKFAEPMEDDEMNALIEEQGELQEKIDAVNGWDLERTLEIAMDALRLPPSNAEVTNLSGGESAVLPSASCCFRSPTCCCSMSRPTILMRNRSRGWRRFLETYRRHRRGDHP